MLQDMHHEERANTPAVATDGDLHVLDCPHGGEEIVDLLPDGLEREIADIDGLGPVWAWDSASMRGKAYSAALVHVVSVWEKLSQRAQRSSAEHAVAMCLNI